MHFDLVGITVFEDDRLGDLGDGRLSLASNHLRGTCAYGHHREQARTRSDIQNGVAGLHQTAQDLVVGAVAPFICQHRKMPCRHLIGQKQLQVARGSAVTRLNQQGALKCQACIVDAPHVAQRIAFLDPSIYECGIDFKGLFDRRKRFFKTTYVRQKFTFERP